MCLVNNDLKRLKTLRAKGHVLRRGYKVVKVNKKNQLVSMIYNKYVWELGWNFALKHEERMTRTTPYEESEPVKESIHVILNRDGAKMFFKSYIDKLGMIILPVWFYCDEVTGYDDIGLGLHTITVSRVLVKKMPKVTKGK